VVRLKPDTTYDTTKADIACDYYVRALADVFAEVA